jgi:hypothetical protein
MVGLAPSTASHVRPVARRSCQRRRFETVFVAWRAGRVTLRDRTFDTREQARSEIFEYIEVFYNRHRAHSLLSYEAPDAFEDCFEKKNAA